MQTILASTLTVKMASGTIRLNVQVDATPTLQEYQEETMASKHLSSETTQRTQTHLFAQYQCASTEEGSQRISSRIDKVRTRTTIKMTYSESLTKFCDIFYFYFKELNELNNQHYVNKI